MIVGKLLLCFITVQVSVVLCDYGVMHVSTNNDGWQSHFCIYYNPNFHKLPKTANRAQSYNLIDMSSTVGCNASDYNPSVVNGTVVIVARNNCTFVTKASLAQAAGAKAIVIASNTLLIPGASNETVDYHNINITVASIQWSDVRTLKTKEQSRPMSVYLYSPVLSKFDASIILFFFLSITCITVGGAWSGNAKYRKTISKAVTVSDRQTASTPAEGGGSEQSGANEQEQDKDESVDISLKAIVVFLVVACTFLVLMYFFYDYLVYVVIILFAMAGAIGLYSCIQPWLWKKLVPWPKRIPQNKIPLLRSRPQYRNITLGLLCLGVGIFWFVERHASYAWIVQDFLGVVFCVNVLRTVTIPNLKICTILLVFLFIYDVFFVFITPLITKTGDSIMVKVATGGDTKTKEKIPMVFISPKLSPSELGSCPLQDSILGFGDVVVPGLLIAHNYAFDKLVNSKKVYYISTIVAYIVGLGITYIALAFMETGQPALMYLVPCTLLTTIVIGCIRGEVGLLWRGVKMSAKQNNTDHNDRANGATGNVDIVHASTNSVETESNCSSIENENRQLLQGNSKKSLGK